MVEALIVVEVLCDHCYHPCLWIIGSPRLCGGCQLDLYKRLGPVGQAALAAGGDAIWPVNSSQSGTGMGFERRSSSRWRS